MFLSHFDPHFDHLLKGGHKNIAKVFSIIHDHPHSKENCNPVNIIHVRVVFVVHI